MMFKAKFQVIRLFKKIFFDRKYDKPLSISSRFVAFNSFSFNIFYMASILVLSSAKRTATQSLVTAKLKERSVFERFCL